MKSLTLSPSPTAASFSPDPHRPVAVAAPTCLRVLVAEDQPLVRRLMVRTIEQLGHEVVGAEDGLQAWTMFMQRPADVVITDWLMPEMDGLDLCRRLRAGYTDTAPYVILASVMDDPNDVQNGLEAGANEYLIKPVARADLEARLLAVEHMIREHARQIPSPAERPADRDDLTGLFNRTSLHQRLAHTIAAGTDQQPVALVLLDLDGFKDINDAFGHQCGDDVLRQVAQRLLGVVHMDSDQAGMAVSPERNGAWVARLGGDEFAVLANVSTTAAAMSLAHEVRAALSTPFEVSSYSLDVSASIGVALYPAHGADADTLLRRADVAMSVAKRAERGVMLYHPEGDRHTPARLAMTSELRRALEQGDLALHYQPKVSLATGQPVGVEALARWPHPDQGWVPPDQFIPLAEQTGLIRPLTRWVLETAVHQAMAWSRAGLDVPIAVNLSAHDLDDTALPGMLAELLRRSHTSPDRLQLEITESCLMRDPDRTLGVLRELRDLGLRISLDDFGTGYSSLTHLKRLPIHELKVDRSFVRNLADDPVDATIVRSTIQLAHALGLTVVAEGVEDARSFDLLAELGCDVVQGFHVSRPLVALEAARWLRQATLSN